MIDQRAAILPPASPLYLSGPYIREGVATAPSNQAFDRSLRDRNATWGLRDLEEVAALSLRSIQTRRVRNGAEQSSLRPEPARSQPELGSARSRSGRRDGAIRRIFSSGYHRNARKQSERGVSPSLIVSLRVGPASERSLSKFTPGAWLLTRRESNCLPAQMRQSTVTAFRQR